MHRIQRIQGNAGRSPHDSIVSGDIAFISVRIVLRRLFVNDRPDRDLQLKENNKKQRDDDDDGHSFLCESR